MIELRGVRKGYLEGGQERLVFRELNGELRRGEISLLMGRSGTGKSTLLNLISGIDLPDHGNVWVDGVVMSRLAERERTLFRRRNIGFVFQFFNLVPTLTVEENLRLPLELNGKKGEPARRIVRDFLEQVELADRAGSFPDRLSGGEQQRVAIVRALVHDPLLILADEPTGNLDIETGAGILALLARLTRDGAKTLIMATHSAEAEAYADRVFTIRDGELVERQGKLGIKGSEM
ncbi:MAG: ABC transporter ATP-binding protein [Gammaproteobacteria bacterium]|nr:ABC transporter ATP-binding protein [Gammaproteobacteria bacterium]